MDADLTRLPLPERLTSTRAIVLLPKVGLAQAIAPIEVLIQEGFDVLSVPAGGELSCAALRDTFGRRLFVGSHDITDLEQTQRAIDDQAGFVCYFDCDQAGLLLRQAGVAALPAALTPLEVAAAWRTGASAVQVLPVGLFGNSYAAQLAGLLPDVELVARGAEASYEAAAWLNAGAAAVCVGGGLLADAFAGGDLAALRTRCRSLAEATSKS